MPKEIKAKYLHSPIGRTQKQKDTVKCLGFKKLNEIKSLPDNDCIRGMLNKIPHLVQIVEG
ncbi:50S ribosomal protein L30 [bacterium K02(2017)]|nr:50S ribosomal protein L30 [bacterium K02(2017)]